MARIILLEPNHILGAQYAAFLKKHGHKVIVCEYGQDAIMQADASRPDVIVMELLLAGHSGIEFLYEFRSYPEWSDIPIIILSRLQRSHMKVSDKTLGALGVSTYLYKPETTLKRLQERLGNLKEFVTKDQ